MLLQSRHSGCLVQFEGDHIVRFQCAAELTGNDGIIAAIRAAGGGGGFIADQLRAAGWTAVDLQALAFLAPVLLQIRRVPIRFLRQGLLFRRFKGRFCLRLLIGIEGFYFCHIEFTAAVVALQLAGFPHKVKWGVAGRALVLRNLC